MEQNKLTEIISEEAQILDLLSRDFKTTVINMLKVLSKIRKIMYKQNENVSKDKRTKNKAWNTPKVRRQVKE